MPVKFKPTTSMNLFEKIELRQQKERRSMKRYTFFVDYDLGNDNWEGTRERPFKTYRTANKRARPKIDFIIIMKSSKTPEEIKMVAGT